MEIFTTLNFIYKIIKSGSTSILSLGILTFNIFLHLKVFIATCILLYDKSSKRLIKKTAGGSCSFFLCKAYCHTIIYQVIYKCSKKLHSLR